MQGEWTGIVHANQQTYQEMVEYTMLRKMTKLYLLLFKWHCTSHITVTPGFLFLEYREQHPSLWLVHLPFSKPHLLNISGTSY